MCECSYCGENYEPTKTKQREIRKNELICPLCLDGEIQELSIEYGLCNQLDEKSFRTEGVLTRFLNSFPDDMFSSGDGWDWSEASMDALVNPIDHTAEITLAGRKTKIEIDNNNMSINFKKIRNY